LEVLEILKELLAKTGEWISRVAGEALEAEDPGSFREAVSVLTDLLEAYMVISEFGRALEVSSRPRSPKKMKRGLGEVELIDELIDIGRSRLLELDAEVGKAIRKGDLQAYLKLLRLLLQFLKVNSSLVMTREKALGGGARVDLAKVLAKVKKHFGKEVQ